MTAAHPMLGFAGLVLALVVLLVSVWWQSERRAETWCAYVRAILRELWDSVREAVRGDPALIKALVVSALWFVAIIALGWCLRP